MLGTKSVVVRNVEKSISAARPHRFPRQLVATASTRTPRRVLSSSSSSASLAVQPQHRSKPTIATGPRWKSSRNSHPPKNAVAVHSKRKTDSAAGVSQHWVPLAYRGGKEETHISIRRRAQTQQQSNHHRYRRQHNNHNHYNNHYNRDPKTLRRLEARQADRKSKETKLLMKTEKERLVQYTNDLTQSAAVSYRTQLLLASSSSLRGSDGRAVDGVASTNNHHATVDAPTVPDHRINGQTILDTVARTIIQKSLDGLHEGLVGAVQDDDMDDSHSHRSNTTNTTKRCLEDDLLSRSEASYDALSLTLLNMCNVSWHISTITTGSVNTDQQTMADYQRLTEFLLVQLMELDNQRTSLRNDYTSKTDNNNDKNHNDNRSGNQKDLESASRVSAFANRTEASSNGGWLSTIVQGIFGSPGTGGDDDIPPPSSTSQQESMNFNGMDEKTRRQRRDRLKMMARVFRKVASAIEASSVEECEAFPEKHQQHRRETSMLNAQRLLHLLERRPADWPMDTETLWCVMRTMRRAGTLDSARWSNKIYNHYSSLMGDGVLSLTMVLEIYLEAIARERDPEKQQEIVDEVLQTLNSTWDTRCPYARIERVKQASVVINILSFCSANADNRICDAGAYLAKRALGSAVYNKFRSEYRLPNPFVDTQVVPIANYLAPMYALSGTEGGTEISKKMLNYLMHHDAGPFMAFPDQKTCNTVLQALVERHECIDPKERDYNAAKSDFDFAIKTVQFMNYRFLSGVWPNTTTHKVVFRFLDVLQTESAASMAEHVLAMLQVGEYISGAPDAKVTLSTYHRVLGYWLHAGKHPHSKKTVNGTIACTKAATLVQKLEMQSIPNILCEKALERLDLEDLLDLSIRPTRTTYNLVLQICHGTSNPEDWETAAAVAMDMQKRMARRGIRTGNEIDRTIESCIARLNPPEIALLENDIDWDSSTRTSDEEGFVEEEEIP